MKFGSSKLIAAAVAVAGMIGLAPAQAQDVNFSGETVRIVINFGTGSSTDATVRQFAPFVAKYLPGKPTLIVEGKPGGRGTLGAAYMARNAKPDGQTLGVLATLIGRWALGEKMPVDLRKFVQVGAYGGSPVVYVTKSLGVETVADLPKAKSIIVGATAPNTTAALPIRLFLRSVAPNAERKLITGYRGQLGMFKAMRSGEINMAFLNSNLWMQRRKGIEEEGKLQAIMEYGVSHNGVTKPTPGIGVPLFLDAWKKIQPGAESTPEYKAVNFLQGQRGATFHFVLPPGTPERYADVWGSAVAKALSDPEYLAILQKSSAPPPLWNDKAATKTILDNMAAGLEDKQLQATLQSEFVRK